VSTTKDVKTGWNELVRGVGRLSGSAAVGALDEENARKLAWSEVGSALDPLPSTPRDGAVVRPTLSVTTDRLRPAIDRAIKADVQAVLDGRGRGVTGQEVMADVGRDLAEEVQHAIDGNVQPPLAKSTLAARRRRGQGDRTLVASSEMLRSIKVETSADPDGLKDES